MFQLTQSYDEKSFRDILALVLYFVAGLLEYERLYLGYRGNLQRRVNMKINYPIPIIK